MRSVNCVRMAKKLIIGSRGSDLALWQANLVCNELSERGTEAEIKVIRTQGDKEQDLSFDKMEGKDFFTKEIEEALLNKDIDMAVHSQKDLETTQPKGLKIAVVSHRGDPRDMLLIAKGAVDIKRKFSLKESAVVGTSSARRKCRMASFRPDVVLKDLRGNVTTRIEKLRNGKYDAILIAKAGVSRLDLDVNDLHVEDLGPREFIPAPAQGVLAIQIREKDRELNELLAPMGHKLVDQCVKVERGILEKFHGGCQLPLGVFCTLEQDEETFKVWASKANSVDESPILMYGEGKQPEVLIEQVVNGIKNVQPRSIFITRDLKETDLLFRLLAEAGYTVHGRSLIQTTRVEIGEVPKTKWIFFSSKNGVTHFFEQDPEVGNAKYGVIGKGTAEALRKYGKRPDFIGYSSDTKLTAKQFGSVIGRASILFPSARGSVRTVQNQLYDPEQAKDIVVYETRFNNQERVPQTDIVLFTSPSNVGAFFARNKLKKQQHIIALGETTGNALKLKGYENFLLPDAFDPTGMARAVFRI